MDCRYCLIYQLLFVSDVRTPYFLKILKSKKRRIKNGKWQSMAKEEQVPFVYTKSEIPYKSNSKLPERQK